MGEENSNFNKGPWWKPGVQIFSQISTWIVFPIVGALVLGKMLDKKFGTEPVIFLVLAGLGFLITSYGMVRVVKDYIKKIKETDKK
ncbi:MAG: AtpZ/AtpI family protein [Candidatus Paceibacterota bacterium]